MRRAWFWYENNSTATSATAAIASACRRVVCFDARAIVTAITITASAASRPSNGTAFQPSSTFTNHARITPKPIAIPASVAASEFAPLRPMTDTAIASETVVAAALTADQ